MAKFKIAVIGLGLIGGSMAYALRGFRKAEIVGCDRNARVREAALKEKAVSVVYEDAAEAVKNADLVIFCTYPESVPALVEHCKNSWKPGAVITEVCGVKTGLAKSICAILPENVDYVGGHPMAGKEVDGFENASPELFWMTGFIITPVARSRAESIHLIYEMAHYIGATRITVASPQEHDAVIAYTSDLMHAAAAGLCLDYHPGMNRAYTAGAFRDCTRIADINPELWTELFLANAEHTVAEMDRLVRSLCRIRQAVVERDEEKLKAIFTTVRNNKKKMQLCEPKADMLAEYLKKRDKYEKS